MLKLKIKFIVFLFMCGQFIPASNCFANENNDITRILYINSYHPGYKWSDNIEKGLTKSLELSPKQLEISVEYLDSKRFPEQDFDLQANSIEKKYSGYNHNIVVVSDNAAFSFVKEYKEKLFPDIPLVFCGYNDFKPDVLEDISNVTGVNEEMNIDELIEIAIEVQPNVKTLAFILSTVDIGDQLKCEKVETFVIPKYQDQYDIVVLKNAPISEIKEKLATLPLESALFLMGQTSEQQNGHSISPIESGRLISAVSPIPVYTLWDFHMNKGVLGGLVLKGADQGKAAAEMVLQILNGINADSIPVILKSPTRKIFDYSIMERFNIPIDILPENSDVINKPASFYEEYKAYVWTAIIIFSILLILILFLSINILKRRKVERELRKQQDKLEQLVKEIKQEKHSTEEFLNSAPGLFYLYNENWELVRWNSNFNTYTGYTDDELMGKNAIDLFHDSDQDMIRQSMSRVIVTGQMLAEADMIIKSGEKMPLALTGKRIEVDGKYYMCGIGIDISDKRMLEKEVQQSQKMEVLGSLAGGIAHDLNNVLGALIGFSDLIKEDILDNKIPEIDYVDNIITASERAVGIVRQILMFSRREETKRVPTQLKSVVREVIKLMERTIPKSIIIKQDLNTEPLTVLADLNQVHQVIMNLCTNAVHAMRDTGGELLVILDNKEINKEDLPKGKNCFPGIYECVKIQDTGTGINDEVLKDIFNPFFTTKAQGEGTGLGLAVVSKIIESHKGFITVNSKLGEGTVFEICIPVTDQLQAYSTLDEKEDLPGGNETILVVEDEPQLREATVVALTRLGYSVISADDGVEGLELFNSHIDDIALLLTDFAMPRMTGIQMSEKIKEIAPDLPIILCTGYSDGINSTLIPQYVFNGFLHKPLRIRNIARIIRHLFDGENISNEDNNIWSDVAP
jgi:two-component system cell cycle sensor histidine kinase/response regulator CckA